MINGGLFFILMITLKKVGLTKKIPKLGFDLFYTKTLQSELEILYRLLGKTLSLTNCDGNCLFKNKQYSLYFKIVIISILLPGLTLYDFCWHGEPPLGT